MHRCCVLLGQRWIECGGLGKLKRTAEKALDAMPEVQHIRLPSYRMTLCCVREVRTSDAAPHDLRRHRVGMLARDARVPLSVDKQ